MRLLIMFLISFSVLSAEVKKQICTANVESALVTISIEHHVSDFIDNKPKLDSKIFVNTENQIYELTEKILNEKKSGIEFKIDNAPTVNGTNYQVNSINLFDRIPNSSQDDFFFGTIINTDPTKNKYITDFSRFGGELVIIFYCQ